MRRMIDAFAEYEKLVIRARTKAAFRSEAEAQQDRRTDTIRKHAWRGTTGTERDDH